MFRVNEIILNQERDTKNSILSDKKIQQGNQRLSSASVYPKLNWSREMLHYQENGLKY